MAPLHTLGERLRPVALILSLALVAGCDTGSPTTPDTGPAVLAGVVETAAPVATSAAAASPGLSSPAAGITVEVEGTGSSTVTGEDGSFRLEVPSDGSPIRLRFRGSGFEATLTLQGLTPGTLLEISVVLDDQGANLESSHEGRRAEFDGNAALREVRGESPNRVLVLDVRDDGRTDRVHILEARTRFDSDGDLEDFGELLRAFNLELPVEVEGEGRLTEDGAIAAAWTEAEVDDDDGGEFEGAAALVEVRGEAPSRILLMDVRDDDGRTDRVRVREDSTVFDPEGDLVTFDRLLGALENERSVEVEGVGRTLEDGTFAALWLKAETEEDDDDEAEFEGRAAFRSVSGEAPARTLRLDVRRESGHEVVVDVREGRTVLDNEGDYTSFGDLLAAAQAGVELEVEGEGTPQEDGSIAATELKAERED